MQLPFLLHIPPQGVHGDGQKFPCDIMRKHNPTKGGRDAVHPGPAAFLRQADGAIQMKITADNADGRVGITVQCIGKLHILRGSGGALLQEHPILCEAVGRQCAAHTFRLADILSTSLSAAEDGHCIRIAGQIIPRQIYAGAERVAGLIPIHFRPRHDEIIRMHGTCVMHGGQNGSYDGEKGDDARKDDPPQDVHSNPYGADGVKPHPQIRDAEERDGHPGRQPHPQHGHGKSANTSGGQIISDQHKAEQDAENGTEQRISFSFHHGHLR